MPLGDALTAAADQAWPPFAIVAGLLAIGAAADAEGAFRAAARRVARPGAPPARTLLGLLALTALTSAVLNLDTAAAFMTPVMLYAGRDLDADEAPFLYGAVLMANAGSLVLPGSNLTNLLVLGEGSVSGARFFATMAAPALAAVAITAGGLLWWAGRLPARGAGAPARDGAPWRPGPGVAAVLVAAVLVVALPEPALPVLAVGALVGAAAVAGRRLSAADLRRAVGPISLLALLALAVALGTLAREWEGPARLLDATGAWGTAAIGGAAAVTLNNLPSAALLSAQAPEHPYALLIGLDLGPNLAVTGSLSALIWWRTARRLGARPSAARFSRVGAPLALAAGVAALALL